MNILDTNGVSYVFDRNLVLQEDYYLAPDVEDEVEVTQLVHERRISGRILRLNQIPEFDEATYLEYYNTILNKYGGRSFYNMTGFGDVSILASLHTITGAHERLKQSRLFPEERQIAVFTSDEALIKKIEKEFSDDGIVVRCLDDIF